MFKARANRVLRKLSSSMRPVDVEEFLFNV